MASTCRLPTTLSALVCLLLIVTLARNADAGQLNPWFYSRSCPQLESIVFNTMKQAVRYDPRMAASILRLFFHDCFVNGCDASVLLDDKPNFKGEKNALPNKNSARGFEVIDAIKANVEASCKATVSCADILALAARDGVVLLGGPYWPVPVGRRDSTTASENDANSNLPGPLSDLTTLIRSFASKGLTARDLTALSGGHTIGYGRCETFRRRLYNDRNIDQAFAANRRDTCPAQPGNGDNNLAPIDPLTPFRFDNAYYKNLVAKRGLFHSDQELYNGGSQDALVLQYSQSYPLFAKDFSIAMTKMGNISPLTGYNGQIRRSCRVVN